MSDTNSFGFDPIPLGGPPPRSLPDMSSMGLLAPLPRPATPVEPRPAAKPELPKMEGPVVKSDVVIDNSPPSKPPLPGRMAWVPEAMKAMVMPSRQKGIIVAGLASLAAGALVANLMWPAPNPNAVVAVAEPKTLVEMPKTDTPPVKVDASLEPVKLAPPSVVIDLPLPEKKPVTVDTNVKPVGGLDVPVIPAPTAPVTPPAVKMEAPPMPPIKIESPAVPPVKLDLPPLKAAPTTPPPVRVEAPPIVTDPAPPVKPAAPPSAKPEVPLLPKLELPEVKIDPPSLPPVKVPPPAKLESMPSPRVDLSPPAIKVETPPAVKVETPPLPVMVPPAVIESKPPTGDKPIAPAVTPDSFVPAGQAGKLVPPAKMEPVKPASALAPREDYDVDVHYPKANDTWASISRQHLGDDRYADALKAYNANRVTMENSPIDVPPLHVLRRQFPHLIAAPRPADSAPRTSTESRVYEIPSGGLTFKEIAKKALGDENLWGRVWEMNSKLRADEPVPAGTRIKLPSDSRIGE